MLHKSLLLSLFLVTVGSAGQTISGQYDCLTGGSYTLCQNLLGATSGVGNQSSELITASDLAVIWKTTWDWAGNEDVIKSYANVISDTVKDVQLQNIDSAMRTVWEWRYNSQSEGMRANVAYGIWLGTTPSGGGPWGSTRYEIMLWLSARGGVQPVGKEIESGVSIGGYTWNVWRGTSPSNSSWEVISFISASGDIMDFSADLRVVFNYLVANQSVEATQYVQAIQAGTQAFNGSAELVNAYSVVLE